jgi:hypothetical protein
MTGSSTRQGKSTQSGWDARMLARWNAFKFEELYDVLLLSLLAC